MIGRVKFLECYGVLSQIETGRWVMSDRAEATLKELSDRNDIIKTMHRAVAVHGLEEQRGMDQYVRYDAHTGEKIAGRVLAKGLAGDDWQSMGSTVGSITWNFPTPRILRISGET
jgi:type IV secretory pathway VirD2 relaxase